MRRPVPAKNAAKRQIILPNGKLDTLLVWQIAKQAKRKKKAQQTNKQSAEDEKRAEEGEYLRAHSQPQNSVVTPNDNVIYQLNMHF